MGIWEILKYLFITSNEVEVPSRLAMAMDATGLNAKVCLPLLVRGIAVDAFMVLYGVSIFSFIRVGMSQKCFKVLSQTGRFFVKVKECRNDRQRLTQGI